MLRKKIGRVLISTIAVSSAIVSTVVDWNSSHVFNPEWVPHARFHDVMLLVTLFGIMVVSLWLIWRRSAEPEVGIAAATLLQIFFWSSFYVAAFVPVGASPAAVPDELPPQLAGVPLYPNMVLAIVNIALSVLSYWLYRSGGAAERNLRERA